MPVNVTGNSPDSVKAAIESGLSTADQWATVLLNIADGASQTVVAAPASGSRLLITHLYWYTPTGGLASFFQILDGAAGTVLFQGRNYATASVITPYLPMVNILFGDAKAFVIKNVTGGAVNLDVQMSYRAVTVVA